MPRLNGESVPHDTALTASSLSDKTPDQPKAPPFCPSGLLESSIEWDVLNWSVCLNEWARVLHRYCPKTSKVLAVGERNGGLSLWFAMCGYRVICSDRLGPTHAARELHREYGVQDLITYEAVDIFEMPYTPETFDIVACKSVIGGLKPVYGDASTRTLQAHVRAVREIHRVLKVGGCLLAAENMQGSPIHQLARRYMKGHRVGWRHMKVSDWPNLLASFSAYDLSYYGFIPTQFDSRRLNTLVDGINRMLYRLLPSTWKYIAIIRAQK